MQDSQQDITQAIKEEIEAEIKAQIDLHSWVTELVEEMKTELVMGSLEYWESRAKALEMQLQEVGDMLAAETYNRNEIKAEMKSEVVRQHLEEQSANEPVPDEAKKEIPEEANFHLDQD